jgi:hypothetical protein
MGGQAGVDSSAFGRRASQLACATAAGLLLCAVGCGGSEPSKTDDPFKDVAPASMGSPGSGIPGKPAATPRSVAGTWAIVAGDMDGTVVELNPDGSGRGCQAGWAMGDEPADYANAFCGPVTGQVDGDHVVFELALSGWNEPLSYIMDGTLSTDGRRIGGVHRIISHFTDGSPGFNDSGPGAAIQYSRTRYPGPFPVAEPWPAEIGRFADTRLVTAGPAPAPFVSGKEYRLKHAFTTLGGDLGEFLGNELSFEGQGTSDLIVHAGPVPRTVDDMPVRLAIHFSASEPVSVEVEMPSGETFMMVQAPAAAP